jgi:CelD/BcsL family acetyltransferase involved in cellulose biosynthesis
MPHDRRPDCGSLSIDVCDDIERVRPQWEKLEAYGTPFQTRDWLAPWYDIVAPRYRASPVFVTVADAVTGRPVMFYPLCRRRRRGLLTIEFPDLGVSDYNSALIAPDFDPTPEEMRALWRRICRALPRVDLVSFDKVPERVVDRENPLARLDWMRREDLRAWTLRLPPSKEDYDDRVIARKVRKENRRKRRRLCEEIGALELVQAATPSEALDLFETLQRERRARLGARDLVNDPCFFDFYRAVIASEQSRFVELWALKAGGRIVATQFALRQPGRYLLVMHSFEPDLDSLSPGIVAIDEMIGRRIDLGDGCFDFTVGNEGYKKQFGVCEEYLCGGLYPMNALGRIYVVARSAVRRARDAIARAG